MIKKEGTFRASFTNVSSRKPSLDIRKKITGFIKEAQCQFVTDSCEQEYFYSWPYAIYISVELSAEEYWDESHKCELQNQWNTIYCKLKKLMLKKA